MWKMKKNSNTVGPALTAAVVFVFLPSFQDNKESAVLTLRRLRHTNTRVGMIGDQNEAYIICFY